MPTLNWIGKDKIVTHHLDVPYHVLEHKYGFTAEGGQQKAETGSGNMIIHGDNLLALKSLLPEYKGKVDCIYIDPPYNTGNKSWVYNDNVDDPKIKKWIGQVVGKEGEDLSRQDKWLCMMYPRLKMLKQLLSSTGVIFISIDDHEQANLKLLCDEIFGKHNFKCDFVWHSEGHSDNQEDITCVHEYILCYANRISELDINNVVDPNVSDGSKIVRDFAENSITKNGYKNPPSWIELPEGFPCEVETAIFKKTENIDELYKRAAELGFIDRQMTKELKISYPARSNDMIVENSVLLNPCSVFSGWMNPSKLKAFIAGGCKPIKEESGTTLSFYLSKNGVIYYKREGRKPRYIQTVLSNMGTTETNRYMLEKMGVTFDYPKPLELIQYLLSIFSNTNSIILDSFAGSGTTAHATLSLNSNDDGNRRFILIEMEDYADFGTSKRIQSAISGFDNHEGLGGAFDFYELGEPIFLESGEFNPKVSEDAIREYIYFSETKQHLIRKRKELSKYLLDTVNGTGYYLYYEPNDTTTLSINTLSYIKEKADNYVIYADTCTLSQAEMDKFNITFKQLPQGVNKV